MADTFKVLYQGQPGTTAAQVYSPGSLKSAVIKHMGFVNTTGTDRTLTIYVNGSAGTNLWKPAMTIVADGSGEWDGTLALGATDAIQMKASAATAITVTIEGDEIS
jgi:hypothetical protein